MKDDLYLIADELRAVASLGIRYSENGYDKERYELILKASARLVAAIGNHAFEDIFTQYTDNLAHLSPILCVEAVVFRQGKILLIQRRDDHCWAVPGGLAEVGESIAQAAERELWEEAGMHGKAVQLMAVYDSRLWPAKTRMQLCMAQFLMHSDEDPNLHRQLEDAVSPLAESLDVGFFDEQHLPELSIGHDRRIAMAFKFLRGEIPAPYFDGVP
jgi:ADP-ribose pyrophosphatase YjhB (NUDIX family)